MTKNVATLICEDDPGGDEGGMAGTILTFGLDGEVYGVEIAMVTEIIGFQKITKMPDMPDFFLGVINLRGKVIPVMEMRSRFRLPFREHDDRTCIIIVSLDEYSAGLVVDRVHEVARLQEDQIIPPPQVGAAKVRPFIRGMSKIDDNIIILIDTEKILNLEDLERLQQAKEN